VLFVYCSKYHLVDQRQVVPSICPHCGEPSPKNVWVRLRCPVCGWEPRGWFEEAPECPIALSQGQAHGDFQILEVNVPNE
jgi:hypothetical protein